MWNRNWNVIAITEDSIYMMVGVCVCVLQCKWLTEERWCMESLLLRIFTYCHQNSVVWNLCFIGIYFTSAFQFYPGKSTIPYLYHHFETYKQNKRINKYALTNRHAHAHFMLHLLMQKATTPQTVRQIARVLISMISMNAANGFGRLSWIFISPSCYRSDTNWLSRCTQN